MYTERSKLKVSCVIKIVQLKTEFYSQHYEHNDQYMLEKKNLNQEKCNISNAHHNGSQGSGLSDDEQDIVSDNESPDVLGVWGLWFNLWKKR